MYIPSVCQKRKLNLEGKYAEPVQIFIYSIQHLIKNLSDMAKMDQMTENQEKDSRN